MSLGWEVERTITYLWVLMDRLEDKEFFLTQWTPWTWHKNWFCCLLCTHMDIACLILDKPEAKVYPKYDVSTCRASFNLYFLLNSSVSASTKQILRLSHHKKSVALCALIWILQRSPGREVFLFTVSMYYFIWYQDGLLCTTVILEQYDDHYTN